LNQTISLVIVDRPFNIGNPMSHKHGGIVP
jgi:hypothetical protein